MSGRSEQFEAERLWMVRTQIRDRGVSDPSILAAFEKVARHLFVPAERTDMAYFDHPLPIGEGQTISQPYMVALMTEELKISGGEKILEIGTGSGYQTAILLEMKARVYSVERIPGLSQHAGGILAELGYGGFSLKTGDGTLGWPSQAPFDRIVVTAGSPSVPLSLQSQLGDGGIMVIPVGDERRQELLVIRRDGGEFVTMRKGACTFVKLRGREGWPIST